jgi:hypothetical protein
MKIFWLLSNPDADILHTQLAQPRRIFSGTDFTWVLDYVELSIATNWLNYVTQAGTHRELAL